MEKVSLKRQSLFLSIGKILGFGVQFLTPIVLVRILTKHDYGIYQQFHLAFSLIVQLFGFGLNSSLFYFFPNNDEKTKSLYLSQTYLLVGSISFLLFISIILFHEPIFQLLNVEPLSEYYAFFGSYLFFMMLSSIKDNLFILEYKERLNLVFYPLEKIVRLSLIVVLLLFVPNVYGCIIALNIYSFIFFAFIFHYLLKNYFTKYGFLIEWAYVKKQLTYSLPFAGAIILNTLNYRVDKVLVNAYVTPDEYAIYTISFFGIPILQQVYVSIKDISLTRISAFAKTREVENAKVLWHKVIYKSYSIVLPAIIFVVVAAEELILTMFTTKYAESIIYFQIFSISFLFQILSAGTILRGFDKTRLIFISNFLGLAITISAGMTLIPVHGLLGAIITAFIASSASSLIQFAFAANSLSLSIGRILPWKEIFLITVANVPAIIFLLLIKSALSSHILTLIAGAIIYSLSVLVVQVKTGIFIYPELLEKFVNSVKRVIHG